MKYSNTLTGFLKFFFTPVIFLFGFHTLWAQQGKEDSLMAAFLVASTDSVKFFLMEELYVNAFRDPDRNAYLRRLQAMIDKNGDPRFIPYVSFHKVNLIPTPDIQASRRIIRDFMNNAKLIGDLKGYARSLLGLAWYEQSVGNYNETLKLLLWMSDYTRDTLKDLELESFAYTGLGFFHADHRDTLLAITYFKKAVDSTIASGKPEFLPLHYNHLGMIYRDLRELDSAELYFRKSIRLYQQEDRQGVLPFPLANMADVFSLSHKYDSAIYYAHNSMHHARQLNAEEFFFGGNYWVLGNVYRMTGQLDSAAFYYNLLNDFIQKYPQPGTLRAVIPDLAEFYASNGNHKTAYDLIKKLSAVNDSVFNAENNIALKEIDAKYQGSKKEQEILKQAEQIKRQRILTFSLIAITFVILLLLLFIYRSNRLKQRSNKLLANAKLKAEQSERFKQQFLANMSHEIRTPMNAVMGMTNLLINKKPRIDQMQYLNGIQKSSDALLHIINDILDLSKVEAGKIEIEPIDFWLRDVVDQVVLTLQHKAEEKGIELHAKVDKSIPEIIVADPTRINQVLMNLAGNAIKFTERGSVTIEVNTTNEIGVLNFSIIDTGIGIPEDKLQLVFESFSQAHASDTRKYGGSGLGLTISKQLVELMGGRISIESQEGVGSAFSFSIPCPEGSISRANQAASQQVDGRILNGLRILVVDDNEYNRVVVHDILKLNADVEITQAMNGREAVELVTNHTYDLILMDIQMPVMNGYDATRQIRKALPDPKNKIPVIALTASVIRSDLDKCSDAGMNDYVPKPFKTDQLIFAIAKATGREIIYIKKEFSIMDTVPELTNITDLAYLYKFSDGDEDRMQKYIRMFCERAPVLIEQIRTAHAQKDYNEIANQVHGFKMNWIMMGMNEAKELAVKIERQGREHDPGISLLENIDRLDQLIQHAINELN